MAKYHFQPVAEKGFASQSEVIKQVTNSVSALNKFAADIQESGYDFPMDDVADVISAMEGSGTGFSMLDALKQGRILSPYSNESQDDICERRADFWKKIGSYRDRFPRETHKALSDHIDYLANMCETRQERLGISQDIKDSPAKESSILELSASYLRDVSMVLRNPNVHSEAFDKIKQKAEDIGQLYASQESELVLRPSMEIKT